MYVILKIEVYKMNIEETGKEYVVTQIEKYNENMEAHTKIQVYNALAFGAESIYVILGLLHEGTASSIAITAMLLAMGLGAKAFVMATLEKVKISNERKNFIQQQIEGMKFETNQEGKTR